MSYNQYKDRKTQGIIHNKKEQKRNKRQDQEKKKEEERSISDTHKNIIITKKQVLKNKLAFAEIQDPYVARMT